MQRREKAGLRCQRYSIETQQGTKICQEVLFEWGDIWEENRMKWGKKPYKNLREDHSRQRKMTCKGLRWEQVWHVQWRSVNESRVSSGRKWCWSTGQRSHLTHLFQSLQEFGFHCRCDNKSLEGFKTGKVFLWSVVWV